MAPEDFYGKKVVIMGLGLHGGGRAAAQWFFQQGAEVVVTDLKDEQVLRSSVISLNQGTRNYRLAHPEKKLTSISYVLGKHRKEDFVSADLVIQNPGVPRESPYLEFARQAGIQIENEVTLLFLLTPHTPKVAVTGTRGKSTTSLLLYRMLIAQYGESALLGVAGVSESRTFFDGIDHIREREAVGTPLTVVMELSSWHLELFALHQLRPSIAIITNVFEDHLNRYVSFEEYRDTKTFIYRFQKENDTVVLNYDNPHTRSFGEHGVPGQLFWFSASSQTIDRGCFLNTGVINFVHDEKKTALCPTAALTPSGSHIIDNALAASTAAYLLGCSSASICEAITAFQGVPSRQEYLGEYDGRRWYDDTTSTSPDATIAALRTLGNRAKKNIILIAGGADKNCDFKNLAEEINTFCKAIILLSGTATPRLASDLGAVGFKGYVSFANSMQEAVTKAWNASTSGDILLLSPGAASFGMFVNEFDRGKQFRWCLESIKRNT